MQLEAISSCPIASYWGELTNPCLTTTSNHRRISGPASRNTVQK